MKPCEVLRLSFYLWILNPLQLGLKQHNTSMILIVLVSYMCNESHLSVIINIQTLLFRSAVLNVDSIMQYVRVK